MRSTSSSSSGNNPDARNLPPPHIEAFNEEPFKTLKDSITQKYINDDATRRTLVERCLESPIINVDTNCGFFPEFQKDMTRNYCAVFDAAAQIESEAIEKIKKERTLKSAVVLMGPPGAGKSTFSEQALSLHKAMHGLSSSDGIIIFDRNSGGHYEKELQFMEELTDLGIPLSVIPIIPRHPRDNAKNALKRKRCIFDTSLVNYYYNSLSNASKFCDRFKDNETVKFACVENFGGLEDARDFSGGAAVNSIKRNQPTESREVAFKEVQGVLDRIYKEGNIPLEIIEYTSGSAKMREISAFLQEGREGGQTEQTADIINPIPEAPTWLFQISRLNIRTPGKSRQIPEKLGRLFGFDHNADSAAGESTRPKLNELKRLLSKYPPPDFPPAVDTRAERSSQPEQTQSQQSTSPGIDEFAEGKQICVKAHKEFGQDAFTLRSAAKPKEKADLRADGPIGDLLLACGKSSSTRWTFEFDQANDNLRAHSVPPPLMPGKAITIAYNSTSKTTNRTPPRSSLIQQIMHSSFPHATKIASKEAARTR